MICRMLSRLPSGKDIGNLPEKYSFCTSITSNARFIVFTFITLVAEGAILAAEASGNAADYIIGINGLAEYLDSLS